jgi:hypothetical protein
MLAPDELTDPAATPEITGGTTTLFAVTETLLVAVLPAASLATAVRVRLPLATVVVSQE